MAASALVPVECATTNEAVSCFDVTVPADARRPDGSTVRFRAAFVDNGDPNGIGTVAYLHGGPGIGAAAFADRFVGSAFDVVTFDGRGTGASQPSLACDEVEALWGRARSADAEVPVDDDVRREAYRQCLDRLRDDGVDLDLFNTTAVATDVEVLRLLLEEPPWQIWGVSYGTRVGLTLMRDHPDGVRAAVLDSVVPFEVDFFATLPDHALRAIEALDAACDADACQTDHGDFATTLAAEVDRLNERPTVVETSRAVSGELLRYEVDGAELLDLVFSQLYSTRALPALPRQVSRLDFGGADELVDALIRRRDPERFDLAHGAYYTTWCREEFPFHDPDADDLTFADAAERYGEVFSAALDQALGSDGIDELCAEFDVAAADAIDNEPLRSDIPTIVFAGSFDPITPPAWSRAVADSLAAATYIEITDHGHGMSGACPRSLFVEFLNAPEEPLDTSCVAEVGSVDFE